MSSLTVIWVTLLISVFTGIGGEPQEIEEITVPSETVMEYSPIRRRPIASVEKERIYDESERIELIVEEWPIVVETQPETEAESSQEVEEYYPLFTVNGHLLDESIQKILWEELSANGIGWWMPYAVQQMYQESAFKVYDITNGLDYGILQYRKMYWDEKAARYGIPGADIFDVYAQIHVYTQETKKRLNEYGLDIYETISRHKTSDYGSYDSKYVEDVLNHTLEQVR